MECSKEQGDEGIYCNQLISDSNKSVDGHGLNVNTATTTCAESSYAEGNEGGCCRRPRLYK